MKCDMYRQMLLLLFLFLDFDRNQPNMGCHWIFLWGAS